MENGGKSHLIGIIWKWRRNNEVIVCTHKTELTQFSNGNKMRKKKQLFLCICMLSVVLEGCVVFLK